jgi:hypothetical protein
MVLNWGLSREGAAMDRLLRMSEEQFVDQMMPEVREMLRQIAVVVNDAPDGSVINASEMKVRDLMALMRTKAYARALQMRIDSTESSFSPSERCIGDPQAEQGPLGSDGADGQRPGGGESHAVARPRRRR